MDRPEGLVEEEDEGVPDVVPDELQSQTCSPALSVRAEAAPVNVGTSHAHRDSISRRIARLPLHVRILSRANGHRTTSVCITTPKYRDAAMTCQARPGRSSHEAPGHKATASRVISQEEQDLSQHHSRLRSISDLWADGRRRNLSEKCRSSLSRTRAPILVPHARSERPMGARPRPKFPAIRPGAVPAD